MEKEVKPQPKNTPRRQREPLMGCAIGKKGIGKTYMTMALIRRYVAGAGGIKPRKFLIFDVNDEFSDIKAISLKDIQKFSQQIRPEIRRIRIFHDDRPGKMTLDEMADALSHTLDCYRGGGLLVEDITKYTGDSYNRDIIGAICTQRHMDVDMILHFQTIGKMGHPKIWGNLNYVRMHKTSDTVDKHKNKFGEYQHLKICEALVEIEYRAGNQRFACYLDRDVDKISGAFTKESFTKAIDKYIQDNYNEALRPLLSRRGETGQKQFSHQSAMEHLRNELFNDYYGNK